MKENYLIAAFRKTAGTLPDAPRLNEDLDRRMAELREIYANASKAQQFHLEGQILPGIAVYQTLQAVLPKEAALETVRGYIEDRAWAMRKHILRLMKLPGLYRLVPTLFAKGTRKFFGEAAGFSARELDVSRTSWRLDMLRCPYHDVCTRQGCPELCPCFCGSDDITYDNLHPRLRWRRTTTLGRGGSCCDFCLTLQEDAHEISH